MDTAAAYILAASAAALSPACPWDHPGANPYRGPVVESVKAATVRYGFNAEVSAELAEKARTMDSDGLLTIGRDDIYSSDGEVANLRDMHHGQGSKATFCSGPVSRTGWRQTQSETALIYCASSGECIAIPIICGNVSRVDFKRHEHPEPEFRAWMGMFKPWLPDPPKPDPLTPLNPQAQQRRVFEVSEPSSLFLVLPALVIAGVSVARRSTKR